MEVKSRIHLLREISCLKRDRRGAKQVAKDSVFSRDFYRARSWVQGGGRLGAHKADVHKVGHNES